MSAQVRAREFLISRRSRENEPEVCVYRYIEDGLGSMVIYGPVYGDDCGYIRLEDFRLFLENVYNVPLL